MGTHPIFESDFDCLTDMVCVPCIVIPVVLWIYQNYLRSYLEPVLGPILGPILKPIYAKIEPYIGKYVPNSDSSEAKCPVSGKSSSNDNGSCPGDKTETPTESCDPSPKATKRRVKKAD